MCRFRVCWTWTRAVAPPCLSQGGTRFGSRVGIGNFDARAGHRLEKGLFKVQIVCFTFVLTEAGFLFKAWVGGTVGCPVVVSRNVFGYID